MDVTSMPSYDAAPMASLNRRAFLVMAAWVASAARLCGFTQRTLPSISEPISGGEFQRLSQRLVGRTRLDAQAGATYLSALLAVPGNIALLADLAKTAGTPSPMCVWKLKPSRPIHVA